ncbi:hypothetical protein EU537_10965 [Candidatus Thorarchaeota archaeon]|nr:MAG: hypothetical protein EU537_10965 [Candidatus Thorarchaeota archaeon]
MDIRSQIEEYFDLLDMKYEWNEDAEAFELVFRERKDELPAKAGFEEDGNYFRYSIWVKPMTKWIQIWCDVYSLEDIPADKREKVFLDLLQSNREYAEVCFDYEKDRQMIGTSQEMMIQGLNFDAFREEFLAVPWSVKKFWTKIAKDYELK